MLFSNHCYTDCNSWEGIQNLWVFLNDGLQVKTNCSGWWCKWKDSKEILNEAVLLGDYSELPSCRLGRYKPVIFEDFNWKLKYQILQCAMSIDRQNPHYAFYFIAPLSVRWSLCMSVCLSPSLSLQCFCKSTFLIRFYNVSLSAVSAFHCNKLKYEINVSNIESSWYILKSKGLELF